MPLPPLPEPPWMDQVLFELQGLSVGSLTLWEREFLPSVSLQRGRGKNLTPAQLSSLLRMHKKFFPETDLTKYEPFSEETPDPGYERKTGFGYDDLPF